MTDDLALLLRALRDLHTKIGTLDPKSARYVRARNKYTKLRIFILTEYPDQFGNI